jgi:RNA polymerase sigma-70 factor (ECF subfamily)
MITRGLEKPVPKASPAPDGPAAAVHDHRLIARWRLGDATALADLIARHQGRVARLAQRLMGYPTDVDDLVQEVFVRAWEKLPGFRGADVPGAQGQASLSVWLATITVNLVRSRQRRLRVQGKWRAYWRGRPAEVAPAADSALERDEILRRVRQAVAALPARDREVIVLRYLEQMPMGQIVKVTGLRLGALEVRLHRARAKLRQVLGSFED